jgi:hypothetical protein
MTPAPWADRSSQIPIEVSVYGARNVPLKVVLTARARIGEVESTVDNPQAGIIEP